MSDEDLSQNDIAEVVPENDPQNSAYMDEEIEEVDLRNNSTTYFDAHKDSVYLIASHPTLPLAVSGGGDDCAFLWTTHTSPPKVLAKLDEPTESVIAGGFTADGNWLVLGDMSGRVLAYKKSKSGEKWSLVSNIQETEEVVAINFHPSLPLFAVSSADGSIWLYELSLEGQGTLINASVLSVHTMPAAATAFVGEDSSPRLVSASEDGTVMMWDVYTGNPIYTVDHAKLRGEHPFVSIALSPTLKTAAVGSMDGLVVLIRLEDGSVLRTVDTSAASAKPITEKPTLQITNTAHNSDDADDEEMSGDSVEGLAWGTKVNLVATGNVDGVVTLWDISTWRPRTSFTLQDSVTKLQFVPNTRFLVVSSMDSTVSMYDSISGEKVWECLGHSEGILGFALQNEGKRIITAGDENVCLVFDKPE